jgi:hypothetical protein
MKGHYVNLLLIFTKANKCQNKKFIAPNELQYYQKRAEHLNQLQLEEGEMKNDNQFNNLYLNDE